MKKNILNLKLLQDLDDEINYWQVAVNNGPEKIKKLSSKLYVYEKQLNTLNDTLKELEEVKKELEVEVVVLNDKKEKQKDRQLKVKTNEEFQKLLKEIEHLTEAISNNENKVLENLEVVEKLKAEKPEIEVKYKEELKIFKAEEKAIEKEMKIGEEKAASFFVQREEMIKEIPLEFLSRYNNLSNSGKQKAVVEVKEGMCTACMINVTPQLYNELQINEKVLFCTNCNKFVYDATHEDFGGPKPEENTDTDADNESDAK